SATSPNVLFNMTAAAVRTVPNAFVLSSATLGSSFATQNGTSGQIVTLAGQLSGGAAGKPVVFGDNISSATSPHATASTLLLTNATNSFLGTVTVGHVVLGITRDGALGNANNGLNLNVNGGLTVATSNLVRGGLRFDADNVTLQASRAVAVTSDSV